MEFLSDDWFAAMADAASNASVDADLRLRIGHDVDGVVWRIVFDDGAVSVERGDGPTDVRFTSTRAVAAAIASGERAAAEVFIHGELRIGGDHQLLIEHQRALSAVDDVFASVRSATTY